MSFDHWHPLDGNMIEADKHYAERVDEEAADEEESECPECGGSLEEDDDGCFCPECGWEE